MINLWLIIDCTIITKRGIRSQTLSPSPVLICCLIQMHTMSIISIAAIFVIAIIIGISVIYNYFNRETNEMCQKLQSTFTDHQISFNQSQDFFDYRADRLDGTFDLRGDLIGWQNQLINDEKSLEHELTILQGKCGQ